MQEESLMQIIPREKLLQRELDRIIKLLKQYYNPQKIILFGSFVNGKVKPWSDLDILIIKNTSERLIDRIGKAIKLCKPKVGVDFIVYTPKEFLKMLQIEPFVQKEIFEKGRVLYERK